MAQGYRNIAGTWRPGMYWRNIAGTWKLGTMWRNIAGTWKQVAPGTVFSPDGGSASDDQVTPANPLVTLTCTTPATWTYTGGAGGTASQASGYVGTSISFTRGTIGTTAYSVHGSSNGIERDFTVTLTKESNA